MKISIVTWDACYRDFIHCIDSLERQSLSHCDYELIIVEQFNSNISREFEINSSRVLIKNKIESLNSSTFNVSYYNFGDNSEETYNVGKLLNYGIKKSRGNYILVIDGDMLFDYNFLEKCYKNLIKGRNISCFRRVANFPSKTKNWYNWKSTSLQLKDLKNCSVQRFYPLFRKLNNYGQMLGFSKTSWESLDGYVENDLFKTSWSKVHKDFCMRLIKYSGQKVKIINSFAYHPWHPTVLNSNFKKNELTLIKSCREEILQAQENFIEVSIRKGILNNSQRESDLFLNQIISENRENIAFADNIWRRGFMNTDVVLPKIKIHRLKRAAYVSSLLSFFSIQVAEKFYKLIK